MQEIAHKEYKIEYDWMSKGTVQVIKIWWYDQMIYAQTRICLSEWNAKIYLGFGDINESTHPSQKTGLS